VGFEALGVGKWVQSLLDEPGTRNPSGRVGCYLSGAGSGASRIGSYLCLVGVPNEPAQLATPTRQDAGGGVLLSAGCAI